MKFSFWKAGNYQFPVGFLYEDMALMTKIYAESGGFAVVSKTSYLWRVRVGGGSSITQERWNMTNLTHRLKAILDTLDVLNDKFPENSANQALRNYYIWSTARYDINFYLPWVEHTDQAFFKELQASGERLFGEADERFWKQVPDRYRVALRALVANDRQGVIAAIRKSGLQVPAPTS
jgi:CDP-glycerol glycerophosphotransferase